MDDLADRLGIHLNDDSDRAPYVTLGEARAVLELLTLLEGSDQPDGVRWAAGELRARVGLRLPS
ncbi:hypothetical protein ACFVHW_31835 [Streptomyces sp. NPDC127110]|uniref:hypothetical protein n=1 Tax=Streptomyces sp. NPDC127110 TaxID=3345362 RepID=UPI003636CE87